ncbi:uncharacterized protein LOC107882714 [Acyrthosiphon pisum]|uniref:Endonuclease-reverse transcriptase n=1 Tax=Acyrthosiphon pisum TaxID=7029 RepID=A0A8R2H4L7_ACYPI|nr:uncharacterized protein LOC107882714 [Acyrthosiphon pisum]|eukprot:XP_016657006.1 PREDICTED: uncharacterized protein LOC107882714 [Acyrthosiphon pisum]
MLDCPGVQVNVIVIVDNWRHLTYGNFGRSLTNVSPKPEGLNAYVALYGAESWIILKAVRRKIEAFETWCWRRVLKIPWTDRVTNEDVYKRINEKRSIWTTIVERRKKWIRHLIRNNTWITTIIEGKPEGKPGRERPRQSYMKQIMMNIGRVSYKELKRVAMNREKWKDIS